MSKTIEQLKAENKGLKQDLASLKTKFEALSSFEKNAKEIFWQMDFSLKTTYISPAIKQFLGYTSQEFISKNYEQLVTPKTFQKVLQVQQQFVEAGKLSDKSAVPEYLLLDIEYVDKQGKTKFSKTKFSLYFDDKGNPKGVQGYIFYEGLVNLVSRETEQMKSFFNSFFSQSVEGVFLFLLPNSLPWNKELNRNLQLKTILDKLEPIGFNDVILKQFEMTTEEFSAFRISQVPNINSTYRFWEKLFDEGKIQIKQLMKTHLGNQIAVEGEFVVLYNDRKEIVGIFGIQHNITDSFLLEKTTENELKLKDLWDKANIAIFVAQDDKIVFWNHAAFEIIKPDISKEKEFLFSNLIFEEDLPLIAERHHKRIAGENVESTYSFRIKTSQGEIRWLQLHSAFYIWNNKPATLNFARDITQEIALKKQLELANHRFEILSQNSSDIIVIYEGMDLVYLSENTKNLLGYIPEFKTVFELIKFIHPEDQERIQQEMEAIIKKQKKHATLVYRIQHISGKYLWWEVFIDIKYVDGKLDKNIAVARDITKRKELELEISKKETLYRLLAENTSDGVALYEYGKLIYQSPGREKMLGETPQIETIEDSFKYIHPQDIPGVQKIMADVLQKKIDSFVTQYRVKHSLGHYIWVEILVNIEYDKAGNPARVIFKTRDISSRILLEEQTRKSEAQYRLLAENSTDGVMLFENGELIYMSPSYRKILGDFLEITRIEEMFDYVHPEDLPSIKAKVKRIIDERIDRDTSTYRIRKSDGSYVWFEDIIHSEFDETGNQTRVILNSRDVTKRIETQRALKEKEKQIDLLLDNMSDFLFLIDKDGIIKYTTPFTLNYFGYQESEIFGKSLFEFIYSADLEKSIFDFSEAVKDKKIKQKLYRIIKKDGTLLWLEVNGNATENDHLEFVIVGRDISERIQIQEQLKKQHKELVELNATKDKFFSILAHDLRSPFNQIMGFSNLLEKNIYQYDTDKIVHFVNIIRNSSVKAYQLLENLLNWSMSKRGMMEFYPVILNIIPLVEEEINRLSEQIKIKNIDLQLKKTSNLFLSIDENMFRIIIRNLVNNAIKFTSLNGKINIWFEKKDAEIIIYIRDNGIGMSSLQAHSLFELSENRSTEGTKGEKGTGLGLLVVKDFMEKHNARIEVKSQKDKGTEIQLFFPKTKETILS